MNEKPRHRSKKKTSGLIIKLALTRERLDESKRFVEAAFFRRYSKITNAKSQKGKDQLAEGLKYYILMLGILEYIGGKVPEPRKPRQTKLSDAGYSLKEVVKMAGFKIEEGKVEIDDV